jgi:16S rRNA C967 or C1407 C5-methylase (RsmB/RsmF family)
MATAKESLRDKVDRLSEEEASEVLELMAAKEPGWAHSPGKKLTREDIRARLAGRPGFRVPPEDARPFRRVRPIDCPGVPASDLLIADRR